MIEFGIYGWFNLITGRVLVGQTGNTVRFIKRKAQYIYKLKAKKWENLHFQRSWNKYGASNFDFRVVEILSDNLRLTERENFWIEHYRNLQGGVYNQIGPADAPRRGAKNTIEHNMKTSLANRGKSKPKQSIETIEKRRFKTIGLKRSEQARRNISAGKVGKGFSKKHRENLSLARKNKFKDPEFYSNFYNKLKKCKIERIDIYSGEVIEYNSIREAARAGNSRKNISRVLKYPNTKIRKYFWRKVI